LPPAAALLSAVSAPFVVPEPAKKALVAEYLPLGA
jgi:hypothetical protein